MTARKRLLAAASAIALVLSGAPVASTASAEQAAPVATTATASPGTPNLPEKGATSSQFSAANSRSTLQFTEYKSYKQLYSLYPETRELVTQVRDFGESDLVPAKGSVSRVGDNMYFFHDNNFGSCGSLGCAYAAFIRSPDGAFTNVLNVSIPGPIDVKTVNGEQSFLLCTHEGQFVEWKMQGSQMEPVPMPIDATRESCAPAAGMNP